MFNVDNAPCALIPHDDTSLFSALLFVYQFLKLAISLFKQNSFDTLNYLMPKRHGINILISDITLKLTFSLTTAFICSQLP